jgi:phospholipid N-methyltransferase
MTSPSHLHLPRGKAVKRPPDGLLFFSKFLRHGTAIAAFLPSSPCLARAVVRGIDFTQARCIVELGAGTGPITAEILRRSRGRCPVVVVERDADFCKRLRERFPKADIAQADAADLDALLAMRGVTMVDHVFCGLPLPSFPAKVRDRVLDSVRRHLAREGTFRQLTHMPMIYYPLYRKYFDRVEFRFVVRNLPPGGFYVCQGPRPLEWEGDSRIS